MSTDELRKLVLTWPESGLTQPEFCKLHNLRYHLFQYHFRVATGRKGNVKPESSKPTSPVIKETSFKQLTFEVPSSFVMELRLADGSKLNFHQLPDAAWLKQLLHS